MNNLKHVNLLKTNSSLYRRALTVNYYLTTLVQNIYVIIQHHLHLQMNGFGIGCNFDNLLSHIRKQFSQAITILQSSLRDLAYFPFFKQVFALVDPRKFRESKPSSKSGFSSRGSLTPWWCDVAFHEERRPFQFFVLYVECFHFQLIYCQLFQRCFIACIVSVREYLKIIWKCGKDRKPLL